MFHEKKIVSAHELSTSEPSGKYNPLQPKSFIISLINAFPFNCYSQRVQKYVNMPNAHEPKKAYFPSSSNRMKVEEIRASILRILRVTECSNIIGNCNISTNNHPCIEPTHSHFHSLDNNNKPDCYKVTYGLTICII